MAIGLVWMYFEIFETKLIPLEEMAEKFGDTDAVVVHLSDAMAEADSKRGAVEHHERSEEAEQKEVQGLTSTA